GCVHSLPSGSAPIPDAGTSSLSGHLRVPSLSSALPSFPFAPVRLWRTYAGNNTVLSQDPNRLPCGFASIDWPHWRRGRLRNGVRETPSRWQLHLGSQAPLLRARSKAHTDGSCGSFHTV